MKTDMVEDLTIAYRWANETLGKGESLHPVAHFKFEDDTPDLIYSLPGLYSPGTPTSYAEAIWEHISQRLTSSMYRVVLIREGWISQVGGERTECVQIFIVDVEKRQQLYYVAEILRDGPQATLGELSEMVPAKPSEPAEDATNHAG